MLRDVLRGKQHAPSAVSVSEKHPAQQLQRSRSGILFVERALLRESPYFKEVRRRANRRGVADRERLSTDSSGTTGRKEGCTGKSGVVGGVGKGKVKRDSSRS